jgi:hypothetical protein
MPETTVRVYNFDTGIATPIPPQELTPGMVRTTIQGIEGLVWIASTQAMTIGSVRQPPLPPEVRQQLEHIHAIFGGVLLKTLPEWEDCYRRATHPGRELATWVQMARVLEHFTQGRTLSPEQRQDIFTVIRTCINNGPKYALLTANPVTLSKKRVQEIVTYMTRPA